MGYLANWEDIRKQLYDLWIYKLLCNHIVFQDKDLYILCLYNALNMGSRYRLDIRLENYIVKKMKKATSYSSTNGLKVYEIKYGFKSVLLFQTYIDSIHREDFLPNSVGNDKRVDEMLSHIGH